MELIWHFIMSSRAGSREGEGRPGACFRTALSEEPCPSSGIFRILRPFPPSLSSSAALLDLPSDDGLSETSSEAAGSHPQPAAPQK